MHEKFLSLHFTFCNHLKLEIEGENRFDTCQRKTRYSYQKHILEFQTLDSRTRHLAGSNIRCFQSWWRCLCLGGKYQTDKLLLAVLWGTFHGIPAGKMKRKSHSEVIRKTYAFRFSFHRHFFFLLFSAPVLSVRSKLFVMHLKYDITIAKKKKKKKIIFLIQLCEGIQFK